MTSPSKVKRRDMLANQVRARIAMLRKRGHSLSSISRLTGKSFKHVKQIVEQERCDEQS